MNRRTLDRACRQAWVGLCSWMVLHTPKLYAWMTKDNSPLSKKEEVVVLDFIQKRNSHQDHREMGLQPQPHDRSGILIAVVVVMTIVTALVIGRPNPFQ